MHNLLISSEHVYKQNSIKIRHYPLKRVKLNCFSQKDNSPILMNCKFK